MDISYLLFLQNIREATHGIFNEFMLFVTHLGEAPYIILVLTLIYWCFNKKIGQKVIFTFGISMIINGLLKLVACVYRPWIRDARVVPLDGAKTTATGYSFPSGHSTGAVAYLGGMAYNNRKQKSISITLIILSLLVMLSRNYIGVHTPQDVVVGCLTSIFCIILSEFIFSWESKKKGRDIMIVIVGIIFALLLLIYFFNKSYPIDYDEAGKILVDPVKMRIDSLKAIGFWIGYLLGWLFEKRCVNFEVPVSIKEKMSIFLPGILITYLLMYAVASAINLALGSAIGNMLGQAIIPFFIMGFYPWLLSKMKKNK